MTVLDFAEEMVGAGDTVAKPSRHNLKVHQELVDAIAGGDLPRAARVAKRQ